MLKTLARFCSMLLALQHSLNGCQIFETIYDKFMSCWDPEIKIHHWKSMTKRNTQNETLWVSLITTNPEISILNPLGPWFSRYHPKCVVTKVICHSKNHHFSYIPSKAFLFQFFSVSPHCKEAVWNHLSLSSLTISQSVVNNKKQGLQTLHINYNYYL